MSKNISIFVNFAYSFTLWACLLTTSACSQKHQVPRADSLRSQQLLSEAHQFLDYSNSDRAYEKADTAEQILLRHLVPTHPGLLDAYLAKGMALRTINRDSSQHYFDQAYPHLSRTTLLQQARLRLLEGGLYYLKGRPDTALAINKHCIQLAKKNSAEPEIAKVLARAHSNLGACYWQTGRPVAAVPHFDTAEQILKPLVGDRHPLMAHPYNNRGLALRDIGYLDKATKDLETCLEIRQATLGDGHPETEAARSNYGLALVDQGNFTQANNFFEIAQNIAQNNPRLWATATSNLGMVASRQRKQAKALQLHGQALAAELAMVDVDSNEVATTYHDIAFAFMDSALMDKNNPGLHIKSLENLKLATLFARHNYKERNTLKTAYGVRHQRLGEYGESERIFRELQLELANSFGKYGKPVATNYYNLGQNAFLQKNYPAAIRLNDSAQYAMNYSPGKALQLTISPFFLSMAMDQRAAIEWARAQQNNDVASLKQCLATCDTALKVYDHARVIIRETADQHLFNEFSTQVLEVAVRTCIELERKTGDKTYWGRAFEYAELTKVRELQRLLDFNRVDRWAKVPDTLLNRERTHRREIAALSLQLAYYDIGWLDPTDQAKVQLDYEHATAQYEATKKEIVKINPAFQEQAGLSLAALREILGQKDNTALVSFFLGKDSRYVFILESNGKLLVQPLEQSFDLEKSVEIYINKGIKGYYGPDGDPDPMMQEPSMKIMAERGTELYQYLIAPWQDKVKARHWTIMPDGVLYHLPFGALTASLPDNHLDLDSYAFLEDARAISHCASASLWARMAEARSHSTQPLPMLALAPFAEQGALNISEPGMRVLKQSKTEVEKIGNLFGTRPLLNTDANKDNLLREQAKHRLLHISSHFVANYEDGLFSYMAFDPKDSPETRLTSYEILGHTFDKDFVGLAGCESGLGQYKRGEGMVGLTSALAQMGTSSMGITLWQVKSRESSDIFVRTYENLAKGMDKDEAMVLAKRDFRSSDNFNRTRRMHPYFWSGIVMYGNTSPVLAY